jgi:hypothetical protein
LDNSSNDRFLIVQRRRIEHDKWCEGIRINCDPGTPYVINWIDNYAGQYRMAWNKSACKECKNYKECGLHVAPECDRSEPL